MAEFIYILVSFSLLATSLSAKFNAIKRGNMKAKNFGLPLAGHKLIAEPLETTSAKNYVSCMLQCAKTTGCIAINFGSANGGMHTCEKLDVDRYRSDNLTALPGWTYANLKTKCDENPCPNYTLCIPFEIEADKYHCIKEVSCENLLMSGESTSGIYQILASKRPVWAYCDQTTDGGGWLVIQRNDRVGDFRKTWQEYKEGFGNLDEAFWWGNEKLHELTKTRAFEIRFDLKAIDGSSGYAKYTGFKLSDENDGYRLYLTEGSYSGTIGNAIFSGYAHHQSVGKKFTTKDKDQDTCGCNCAWDRQGGWWYGWCATASLNGDLIWLSWYRAKAQSEIKIRPMISNGKGTT